MATQTDNSLLAEKVLLRLNSLKAIPKKRVRVLECFGGNGVIWGQVRAQAPLNKQIDVLRMDVKTDRDGVYLKGDNRKFLTSIPLNDFDIIDLDAYGSPYDQLKIIFERGYKGLVHCTFIQSSMGGVNHEMLQELGYTKAMIKKCPTIFSKDGFKKICAYLYKHGVRNVQAVVVGRKSYFWFLKE